jgi:membrane-bound ClpP family serine protease
MSRRRLSRRLLKRQLRYAIHGIAIGLIASGGVISGVIVMVRLSSGRHIGHRVPLGFVLFTTILILIVYRIMRYPFYLQRKTRQRTRSVTRGAVTELSAEQSSAGDQNRTKSA